MKLSDIMEDIRDSKLKTISADKASKLGSEIDLNNSEFSGELLDINGQRPRYLFRYVGEDEYNSIIETGYMHPSKFYHRIHASGEPETQYRERGTRLLLIKTSESDEWKAKLGDKVYATTYSRIPMARLYEVTDR